MLLSYPTGQGALLARAGKSHSRGHWTGLLSPSGLTEGHSRDYAISGNILDALLSLPAAEQFLQAWNKAFRIFAGLAIQLQQWGEKDKYNPVWKGNKTHLSALIEVSGDPFFLSLYLETWKKLCSAVVHMGKKPDVPKLSILASKLAALGV